MKNLFTILVMLVAMNASGQWQPDVRLTNAPNISSTSGNNAWCVASSGSFVHVVWSDNRDGYEKIYYKRSTNGGVSWEADTRLTNNSPHQSFHPSVAVSGSVVHVVWDDLGDNYEIYYKRSTDAGVSWGTEVRMTNNTSTSWTPSIAVSGPVVQIVWVDDLNSNNSEIFYNRSTDAGVSWGTNVRLTNDTTYSGSPSVAVSGSVVHVVWSDSYIGTLRKIYYKRSTDGGVSWGADTRLTYNPASARTPSIAVSGAVIHVVWYDERDGNREIYYKHSTDAGVNWGADIRQTNDTSISRVPSVAVSGSVVHLVWEEYRDGNAEIYYKRSTDAGVSWAADTRMTNNTADSRFSSVAVSGSVVHVVWRDTRDGNEEIYYKRNPTGNVGIQNISTEIPSKYSLSQNYPNPFNPTTTIRFAMPKASDAKVIVYDIMGREVQTLVNERLNAGTYEATFDGSTLNSGVYFYKMVTDGFTETKKMLLIK